MQQGILTGHRNVLRRHYDLSAMRCLILLEGAFSEVFDWKKPPRRIACLD